MWRAVVAISSTGRMPRRAIWYPTNGKTAKVAQQNDPEPKPKARQQLFFLRDINGNLNGVGLSRRGADRRSRAGHAKRLPMPAFHRSRIVRAALRLAGELRQIQLIRHARRHQQWCVSFIQQANIELLVSPRGRFQLNSLRAGHPSRRGAPATWCAARAPCRRGTNLCFSPVRSPAPDKDWRWRRTPTASLRAHSQRLAGRPEFATSRGKDDAIGRIPGHSRRPERYGSI